MKNTILASLILVGLVACKQSQTAAPSPTPLPSATQTSIKPPSPYKPVVLGKTYPGKGVIKLINRKENWIEIEHEDIVDLMPAMEMEWFMEKNSLLNGLKVGDKVTFTLVETKEKGQIITSIKKIKY